MLTGTAVLPREIMAYWLELHNSKGGRLGGQSRFESHLDDMPTAGWGYGAIANNQTQDFLELLYGHAANYQSRGTFHSTEQLPFTGTGRYRSIPMKDPAPGGGGHSSTDASNATLLRSGLGYNGAETQISFCIVSNIIVAHMTRWQLVMEDDGAIWLGRGAPQRWFKPGVGGFNVTAAPTSVGKIDFKMHASAAGSATYSVTVERGGGGAHSHVRVRVNIIGHARIKYVVKYQSCMVYNGRLIPHASYSRAGVFAGLACCTRAVRRLRAARSWRWTRPWGSSHARHTPPRQNSKWPRSGRPHPSNGEGRFEVAA